MLPERLYEYVPSATSPLRVDRQHSVIRGVKILGMLSTNGREYLPAALREAVGLYEGAKVHVNHPAGHPAGVRDYRDRIGVMRRVTWRPGEGLFGDLHFNPKHALAEQLLWDAEHAPENVGFSHNVDAHTSRRADRTQVERIVRVHSVDLVSTPATTRGLFEAEATTEATAPQPAPQEPAETSGAPPPAQGAEAATPAGASHAALDENAAPAPPSAPPWAELVRLVEQLSERIAVLEARTPQGAARCGTDPTQEATTAASAAAHSAPQPLVRLHAREQHWGERWPPPALDPAAFARAIRR